MNRIAIVSFLSLLPFLALSGCSKESAAPTSNPEEDIKAAWASFQEAVKAKDPEKIWGLLDADTQAGAENAAKSLREKYAKATPAEQAELQKKYVLSGEEIATIKGVSYLKSKEFAHPYREVPDSKMTKIDMKGDKAKLHYVEPDNDKEDLDLVRKDGKWKFVLPMTKVSKGKD